MIVNDAEYTIDLVEFVEEYRWADAIKDASGFTLYHDLKYSKYYAYKVDEVLNILIKRNGVVVALISGGVCIVEEEKRFLSPFSASFSGFLFVDGLSLLSCSCCFKIFEDFMLSRGVVRVVLGQPPSCYYHFYDQSLDFLFYYNNYSAIGNELAYFVTKDSVDHAGVRRNLNRAVKAGLRFVPNIDLEVAGNFLILHKKKRNLGLSVPVAEIVELSGLLDGMIHSHGVYINDTLVAAIIVYMLGQRTVMGFNWDQDYDFQQYRCTDFLLYETVMHYFGQGFTIFDLGTVTINGQPNWGLLKYKEKLGGIGCLRTKYSKFLNTATD